MEVFIIKLLFTAHMFLSCIWNNNEGIENKWNLYLRQKYLTMFRVILCVRVLRGVKALRVDALGTLA